MASNRSAFGELLAEMGLDPASVKSMVQHLQDGDDQEAAWRAWCDPLVEQARRIESIVNGCPEQNTRVKPHLLTRPHLHIALPESGGNPYLELSVPGVGGLSMQREPEKGFYLHTDRVHRDEKGAFTGSSEVHAHLELSWYEQSPLLKEHWKALFGTAPAILDATEYSLNNETPMGSSESWCKVLLDMLVLEHKDETNPYAWRFMAHRWGTPEMVAAMGVVDSLFDGSDTLAWREQLLQAWTNLGAASAKPMENLDSAVFTNS